MSDTSPVAEQMPSVETQSQEASSKKTRMRAAYGLLFVLTLVAGGLIYWKYNNTRITIEKAEISAPRIDISAPMAGTLKEIRVREGDVVGANTVLARVDNQVIKATSPGLVIHVENELGKRVNPSEAIITLIDPQELRVIGRLEEDKGLQDVYLGQSATFTVDAFGSKIFYGTVDQISPTSRDAGIVFNISDKREKREFNISVRFNLGQYPDVKNGMSARIVLRK